MAAMAPAAQAQSAAPWFARATVAMLHDTNYLRLADGAAAPAGYSKADTVVSGTLAAGFNQLFGAGQRAYANAELRANRVLNNTLFDNQGWRAVAGLDWRTAGIVSGELRVLTDRGLAAFDTGTADVLGQANLVTLSQADAVFRIGRNVGLNAETAFGWREVDYSAAFYDSREFHEGSASAGLRYRPSDRSSIGVGVRGTRGSYPRYRDLGGGLFQADDYTGRFVDLTATYSVTGKSELRARLSSGRTRHENAVQSDFSGLTGSVDWRWRPTGKLAFTTTLTREPSQDAYFLASAVGTVPLEFSRVSTALRVAADYALTERVRVRASVAGTHRELTQTLPAGTGGLIVLNGTDRTVVAGLGASWQPGRLLTLGCDIGHEVRRGQPPLSADVTSSSLGCSLQVLLEGRRLEGR
jgi:hypothetical protein